MVDPLIVTPKVPMAVLLETFGTNLEFGKELAPLTSFKTGGRAGYFVAAESADDIARAVRGAKRLNMPFFVMGGGSNLLISDEGFPGLVIKVDVSGMTTSSDGVVACGAGEDLMALVTFSAANSLTGLEFAAGIWGTVGGAICGNAGAYGGEVGRLVRDVTLVDASGVVHTVPAEYCQFAYRHSRLKESGETIVSARLQLQPGDRPAIQAKIDDILTSRRDKHPVDGLSAGCFFKNIPDPKEPHGKLPAGRLLEQIGAKELQVGGARVFERHANIIVNTGTATSKDIRQLADILKKKVLEQFGIELQEEVRQLGNF